MIFVALTILSTVYAINFRYFIFEFVLFFFHSPMSIPCNFNDLFRRRQNHNGALNVTIVCRTEITYIRSFHRFQAHISLDKYG